MNKKIYYEPAGRLYSFDREIIQYPPEGYEFLTGQTTWDNATEGMLNNDLFFVTLNRTVLGKMVPVHLVKGYLESIFKKAPRGTALTFSRNHIVFRTEPWVIHVEWPTALSGFSLRHFKRYKGIIERGLASSHCKKILTWSEVARKSILCNLDPEKVEPKLEVIPLAVHKKDFIKEFNGDHKIKLLFIGTENVPGEFHLKGGKEVLQSFVMLCKKYTNLELVVRSDLPQQVKRKYQGHPNIRLIEKVIPWEQLEREFKMADIFLFPGYDTGWRVVLDAMSYELPVVTVDSCANSELVKDGKTGFVLNPPQQASYFQDGCIPTEHTSLGNQFREAIKSVDCGVVEELVNKTGILIETQELRRQMGRAGRWEVEHGKFSIEERNRKLKKIFDEATK